jgi:hypothetical protein
MISWLAFPVFPQELFKSSEFHLRQEFIPFIGNIPCTTISRKKSAHDDHFGRKLLRISTFTGNLSKVIRGEAWVAEGRDPR